MSDAQINIPGYEVGDMIGRGAMASVYAARHPDFQVPLAIKVMDLGLSLPENRQEALSRFRLEANIGRRLNHAGLVQVHDFGQEADLAYMAMDLVNGQPLSSLATKGQSLPWTEAAVLTLNLLAVLHYIHQAGIVHRDVKLANIMRVEGERRPTVKLMDFGVAKVEQSDMTQTGDLIGTPAFMSPEQLEGLPVDARSDLFSVGVIFYTLATGQRPFSGSVASVMHQVLYKDPTPPTELMADLPSALDGILARALAKRIDDRYASAAAFGTEVKQLLSTAQEAFRRQSGSQRTTTENASSEQVADSHTTQHPQATDPVAAALAMFDHLETVPLTPKRRRRLGQALATIQRRASGKQTKAADALLAQGLAPMVRRAIVSAPVPTGPEGRTSSGFGDMCRIIGQVVATITALDPKQDPEGHRNPLIEHCVDAGQTYLDGVRAQVQQEEEPDIAAISPNLIRLEILNLSMALAGCPNGVGRMKGLRFEMASLIMAKVNTIALAHYQDPEDPLARFAMASLLTRVEDLIVIAEQLLHLEQEGEGAVGPVLDFIGHAKALVAVTMEEVRNLSGPEHLELFKGRLKQIGLIHLFAVRLDSDPCRGALKDLVVEVNRLVSELIGERDGALSVIIEQGEAMDRDAGHLILRQLSALHRLAEQMGWTDLEQRLAEILRDKVKILAAYGA